MQFGDGIMSMIDCKINIEKKPDPKGDRVLLTFECVSLLSHSRCFLIGLMQWQVLAVCEVVSCSSGAEIEKNVK